MCDICDFDFGHMDDCPLDDESDGFRLFCSVCGCDIGLGKEFIYDPNGDGRDLICDECIEDFSVADFLEVCGFSSLKEAIAEVSGKVMRVGDRY